MREGRARNQAGWRRREVVHLAQVCQSLHTVMARAKESGERKEKMLAKRSEGRFLHILYNTSS